MVPAPRGGPCEGSRRRPPRRPHPPREGRWAPCGGAARSQGAELGASQGISEDPARVSQGTVPGLSQGTCLGHHRAPFPGRPGHLAGRRLGAGSCGTRSRPSAAAHGDGVEYRERWRVPGSRPRPCWAETLAGGGAAGCLESDVSDGTACPRVWAGKRGRVGSRQRWRAPVPASVRPADASVLRGARGPSRRATAEPAKSQLAAAALRGHRLTPVGPASAALPKSVLPDRATWTSEDAVWAGGLGTSELSSASSPSVSRTGRFGGHTFIFLSLFKN